LYFSGPATNDVPAPIPSMPAPAAPQSGPAMNSGQGSQPNVRGSALVELSVSGTSPSVSPESHPVLAQTAPPQTQGGAQAESPAAMPSQPASRPQTQAGTDAASPAITPAPLAPKSQPKPENSSSTPASAPVAGDTHPGSAPPASSETATAVPAVRGLGGVLIWIVPVAVALLFGCFFMLRRKSQPGAQGSFITRSYDRNEPRG
jgi:hypothetical protein